MTPYEAALAHLIEAGKLINQAIEEFQALATAAPPSLLDKPQPRLIPGAPQTQRYSYPGAERNPGSEAGLERTGKAGGWKIS